MERQNWKTMAAVSAVVGLALMFMGGEGFILQLLGLIFLVGGGAIALYGAVRNRAA